MTLVITNRRYQLLIKLLFLMLTLLPFCNASASEKLYEVDIYGTSKLSNDEIKSRFNPELTTIAKVIHDKAFENEKRYHETIKSMSTVLGMLMLTDNFTYVHVSPINYENTRTIYITIDVVEKNDSQRLTYFLPEQKASVSDPNHLIRNWFEYEKTANNLINKNNEYPKFKNCLAHHCLYGFEHPDLVKYQNAFISAEKYKTDLVKVIRNDKDSNKRAAAAYILAHIKSDQELVELLVPSINDSNSLVRNNVMRVLAFALEKNNNLNVSLEKVINALDFPNTTDRNKALYILSSLANNPKNAEFIKKHAAKQLLATLKLKQPNNHDFSYIILKKISGKNFAERDYKSWENWLNN